MTVGDQDAVEPFKPQAGAHNLALSSLAAVDEKSKLIMHHNLSGQAAMNGGGGCRCAEEDNFEQLETPSVETDGRPEEQQACEPGQRQPRFNGQRDCTAAGQPQAGILPCILPADFSIPCWPDAVLSKNGC